MDQITNIREGLAKLTSALETIVTKDTPATPDATVNSISGNAIHGGKITLLRSTGIRDQATRTSLLVEDDKITVGSADIDNVMGDLLVEDNLTIGGEIKAKTLRVEETYTDQKHNTSLDFQVEGDTRLIGLQWRKKGEATNYLIKTKIEFNLINVDINETFLFQEETKTSSINNKFEFKRYENKILSNFINSKIEQFILKLSSVK